MALLVLPYTVNIVSASGDPGGRRVLQAFAVQGSAVSRTAVGSLACRRTPARWAQVAEAEENLLRAFVYN